MGKDTQTYLPFLVSVHHHLAILRHVLAGKAFTILSVRTCFRALVCDMSTGSQGVLKQFIFLCRHCYDSYFNALRAPSSDPLVKNYEWKLAWGTCLIITGLQLNAGRKSWFPFNFSWNSEGQIGDLSSFQSFSFIDINPWLAHLKVSLLSYFSTVSPKPLRLDFHLLLLLSSLHLVLSLWESFESHFQAVQWTRRNKALTLSWKGPAPWSYPSPLTTNHHL